MDFMDPSAKALWISEVNLIMREQSQRLQAVYVDLNNRGVIHSGVTLPALFNAASESFGKFADAWISIFDEFWQRTKPAIPSEIADKARADVEQWFKHQATVIGDTILQDAAAKGIRPQPSQIEGATRTSIEMHITAAIARCISEIDNHKVIEERAIDAARRNTESINRKAAEEHRAWLIPTIVGSITTILASVISVVIASYISARGERDIIQAQQQMAERLAKLEAAQHGMVILSEKSPKQIAREIRRIEEDRDKEIKKITFQHQLKRDGIKANMAERGQYQSSTLDGNLKLNDQDEANAIAEEREKTQRQIEDLQEAARKTAELSSLSNGNN